MELDDAEEAEVVSATRRRPRRCDHGPTGRDRRRRAGPIFTTTSPNWWVGDGPSEGWWWRRRCSAAMQTAPAGLERALAARLLPPSDAAPDRRPPTSVERVRDGRSFSPREVTSAVDGKETFRLTCSFHAPEDGDEYQLPMGPDDPDAATRSRASRRRSPSTSASSAPTEQREDGTYLSTRRCWFRTREPLPDDPAMHACVLAYFSDMTGAAVPPAEPGDLGDPHRRQPRSRRLVPPAVAGRRLEPLRHPCAGQRRRPGHHPGDDARRGRHVAPQHGAGAADPGARRRRWCSRRRRGSSGQRGQEATMGLLEGRGRS